jgi:HEAT repeat protein
VVAGCVRLIRTGEGDATLILALGGPAAGRFLDGSDRSDHYWLRVWGARGLLWAWDDTAADVIPAALTDEAWRVREMAAKVAAKHLVGDALPVLSDLRDDPVQRVRAAADRAVRLITAAGT